MLIIFRLRNFFLDMDQEKSLEPKVRKDMSRNKSWIQNFEVKVGAEGMLSLVLQEYSSVKQLLRSSKFKDWGSKIDLICPPCRVLAQSTCFAKPPPTALQEGPLAAARVVLISSKTHKIPTAHPSLAPVINAAA